MSGELRNEGPGGVSPVAASAVERGDRYPNFDFIRVLAASSVIFSHSFPITQGHEANEPFVPWLGAILGIYAVYVFLMMSGFLVSQSIMLSTSVKFYLWKRVLRVLPALAVAALLSGVVLSSFYSSLGQASFLSSKHGYFYAMKVLLLIPVWEIRSVSFYPGGWGDGVNGVLWTVQQEVLLYLLVAVLYLCRRLDRSAAVALWAIGSILFIIRGRIPSGFAENFVFALPSFSAGMIVFLVWQRSGLNRFIATACLAVLAVGFVLDVLEIIFPLPAAYLTMYVAMSGKIRFPDISRFGDVTYGTYLYGWPVQQVVRSQLGDAANPYLLFAISLPIALCCGWLSWHALEKRALRWKRTKAALTAVGQPKPNDQP